MRRVRGLREVAEALPPENRKAGGAALGASAVEGLRYEEKVASLARASGFKVKHGQWFKYRDRTGTAYCQTDVLAARAGLLLVLEAKLTQKIEGELKLDRLYVPLMKALYKVPVVPILIFQNILWEPKHRLDALADAVKLRPRDRERVWHLHWSAL